MDLIQARPVDREEGLRVGRRVDFERRSGELEQLGIFEIADELFEEIIRHEQLVVGCCVVDDEFDDMIDVRTHR